MAIAPALKRTPFLLVGVLLACFDTFFYLIKKSCAFAFFLQLTVFLCLITNDVDVMKKNAKILFPESRLQGVKSVSSPSTQHADLCALENDQFLAEQLENFRYFFAGNAPAPLKFITGLLFCYGLRVSEVLSLTAASVVGNRQLYIKGLKGSDSRIVQVIYEPQMIDSLLLVNVPLSAVYSRFWVYRELKRYGLYSYFEGNSNASATHLARHLKVLDLKKSGVPRETISKYIGHKNLKTLVYYEKKLRK